MLRAFEKMQNRKREKIFEGWLPLDERARTSMQITQLFRSVDRKFQF